MSFKIFKMLLLVEGRVFCFVLARRGKLANLGLIGTPALNLGHMLNFKVRDWVLEVDLFLAAATLW